MKGIKGRKAYNNGNTVMYLTDGEEIPNGYVRGGLSKRTPEQIKIIAEKSRLTQQQSWKNKSEDEKRLWSEKCKNAQLNLSEETKLHKQQSLAETLSKRTEEESNVIKQKIGSASKRMWDNLSEEERSARAKHVVECGGGWNKETIKTTVQSNYGVENISQLQETKDKVKESTKITSQERFGTDNPLQAKENRDKIKQAILNKYGVEYIGESKEIQAKIRATLIERHGVPYGFNYDKIRATCQEKYGVEYACLSSQCRSAIARKSSDTQPNIAFCNLLTKLGISYEREFAIKNRAFDFKVGDTLIEINPFATHNTLWTPFNKVVGISRDYHYSKTQLARDNGFRCVHVWDWDDTNKILELISPKEKCYARNCDLREVSKLDCDKFLYENHLQNSCRGQSYRFGLYYKNNLIQLITFGKPRYNKNYQYELLRLCTKSGYIVVGGAEKLFNHFVKTINPKSIISYCDNSKFSGDVYQRLGFCLYSYGKPTCHWYNTKTKEHVTDNLLRQNGFDRLFGDRYGYFGKGTSNTQLMIEHNFVSIYDAGQSTFVWKSDK